MRIATDHLRVHDLRRDRWLGRLALLALWGAGAAYYAGVTTAGGMAICGAPLLLLAGTSLILGLHHGRSVAGAGGSGSRGHVRIEGDEIEIAAGRRALRWARADVVSGWSEPARGGRGEAVVLGARSGVFVSFRVPESVRARDVLNTVGVAPGQRAVVIRLGVQEPGLWRAVMIFLAFIVTAIMALFVPVVVWMIASVIEGGDIPWSMPAGMVAVGVPAFVLLYNALVRPLVPTTVRIGTDGVAIERLFRKRFVPRDAIERVIVPDRDVALWATEREIARLPAAGRAEAEAVAACITAALAEARDDGARAALLEKLDRGGRPLGAWLRELRALAKASVGYREAAGDPRELLDIARNGAAPASRRVAAAAVLAGHGDPQVRIELRAAAASCANPRLRVAIEKAAEGEIDERDLESLPDAGEAEDEALARERLAGWKKREGFSPWSDR